jgi:hypothetical protein
MDNLTDRQINIVIAKGEVEMETNGELCETTSQLLIRALKQTAIKLDIY